jgi:hypothetical protein
MSVDVSLTAFAPVTAGHLVAEEGVLAASDPVPLEDAEPHEVNAGNPAELARWRLMLVVPRPALHRQP